MHEIGLVDDILCVINAKLKELEKTSRVKKVNLCLGELEHITPEHFQFHFRERAKGTPLENVELNFKKIKARFRCRDCRHEFLAEEGLLGCPKCKGRVNEVIAGAGITVDSIEVL